MRDLGLHEHRIRALSGVAGYLCAALDELVVSGCDAFTGEVLELLAAIDVEITVLECLGDGPVSLSF